MIIINIFLFQEYMMCNFLKYILEIFHDLMNAHINHKLNTDTVAIMKSFVEMRCDGGNLIPLRSFAICFSSNQGSRMCKMSGNINPISLIT